MRLALLCLVSMFFFLPGCVQQKLTPDEIAAERARQLAMITRVYPDKKPEEILLAADRIFRLADDDYTVSHGPTALQAQRPWMVYMIISAASGTDTWIVETTPEGDRNKGHGPPCGAIILYDGQPGYHQFRQRRFWRWNHYAYPKHDDKTGSLSAFFCQT